MTVNTFLKFLKKKYFCKDPVDLFQCPNREIAQDWEA